MSNHDNLSRMHEHPHDHAMGYGKYTIIWVALLALTALTVAVAGIDLGEYTLFVALLVATIKAMIVINVFMHIKFDDIVIKGFVIACGLIFAIIFIFLGFDVFSVR